MGGRPLLIALGVLGLSYLFRPVLHGFLMGFVVSPLSLVALGLAVFGAWRIRGQLKASGLFQAATGTIR